LALLPENHGFEYGRKVTSVGKDAGNVANGSSILHY